MLRFTECFESKAHMSARYAALCSARGKRSANAE
jgi:hypothetical protein